MARVTVAVTNRLALVILGFPSARASSPTAAACPRPLREGPVVTRRLARDRQRGQVRHNESVESTVNQFLAEKKAHGETTAACAPRIQTRMQIAEA